MDLDRAGGGFLRCHHVYLDEVDSTNTEAARRIASGAARDFTVIQAKRQTQGRGRRGRDWISPAGNLYCSVVIETASQAAQAAQLGLVAAVALVDAVRGLVPGAEIACKWPNDVMAAGAKLAGMLLEGASGGAWLILGIGVNVTDRPADDRVETPARALAELGYTGDADLVLTAFCQIFMPMVDVWRDQGFAPFQSLWQDRALGLNETVRVRLPTETVEGRFTALDEDGALLLGDDRTGAIRRILAGDVFVGEGRNPCF